MLVLYQKRFILLAEEQTLRIELVTIHELKKETNKKMNSRAVCGKAEGTVVDYLSQL